MFKEKKSMSGDEDRESTGLGAACGVNREVTVSPPEKGRSEQGQEGNGRAGHEYLGRRLSGAKPLSEECAMQAEKSKGASRLVWCEQGERRSQRRNTGASDQGEPQGPL